MGILALAVYAGIIFCISGRMIFSKNLSAKEFFYINNRTSSSWSVAMSILVSCVGASATVGMIGMAFELGTPAFWWLGVGCIGLSILSFLLAKKVRSSGAYTMPELIEKHLGPPARPLISVLIVLAWVSILAAQFVALTQITSSLTGISPYICLAFSFMLVVFHTIGGQAAIMRLDKFQTATLVMALIIVLYWVTGENPTWATNTKIEILNDKFTPASLIYYLLIVGSNYVVSPMLFGRILSAKDVKSARIGGALSALLLGVCAALIVCVGLACVGLISQGTPPDSVLTTALSAFMPTWLKILISIALISAIVSSADSSLITAATVLCHDLLKKSDIKTSRISVILLGLGGIGISFWGKDILQYLLISYSIYACGVVVPVFIALVFFSDKKINPKFACLAIILGCSFGLISRLLEINEIAYVGMATSAILTFLGFSINKPKKNLASRI